MRNLTILVSFLLVSLSAVAKPQKVIIQSPDQNLVMQVVLKEGIVGKTELFYSIKYKGIPVVLESRMGLDVGSHDIFYLGEEPNLASHYRKGIADSAYWRENYEITKVIHSHRDTTWIPVYGEHDHIRNHYNETVIHLQKVHFSDRSMLIDIRAYNTGIAFKYIFPKSKNGKSVFIITGDQTEFTMPAKSKAWVTNYAQGPYQLLPLYGWKSTVERPLTIQLNNGLYVSLTEAEMIDFSRTRFILEQSKPNTIQCHLAGNVIEHLPFSTPWRVVMVAGKPGNLLQNNALILNLNPPNKIKDTSWIKPGKMMREITLTTKGAKNVVDFASKHDIKYMLFDARWYGDENNINSDASKVDTSKHLNLPEVITYAHKHNVGIFLYVNQVALLYQLDQILPLYKKWGVAGLKFGFVHVGPQFWSIWLHNAIREAAENQLMVDVHDEYRPTGFSRTYPNLMTQEGIRGNEEFPDATTNTILPFTRFVAGSADYTICYYDKRLKTTHAHQLALSVVYFCPLQVLFWYDRPTDYHGEPEISFFDHLPTVWDDTKVIDGEIGKYITVARRKGNQWFIGSITNDKARTLEIPLTFLNAGKKYVAHIYSDGGKEIKTRTRVKVEQYIVRLNNVLNLKLKPSGGCAIRLTPATNKEIKNIRTYHK